MKKWNILLLTFAISLMTTGAFAHAIWIETANTGQIGKAQTVRIYYGEFVDGERDSVTKWYSDIKDLELWLVGPDQKKIKLKTTAAANYYEAKFTPGSNGAYSLTISHQAKELGGETKYHFLASADVTVGKPAGKSTVFVNSLQLQKSEITSAQVNKQIMLKASHNNSDAAKMKVSVFSPNGWSKELTTDTTGSVSFLPPFPGRYVIEISDMDKTAGEHYGKPYQETWSGATYSFEVK